jgi:hypothetical protein
MGLILFISITFNYPLIYKFEIYTFLYFNQIIDSI